MTKKKKKEKKPSLPKINTQIPISRIRPMKFTDVRYYLEHAREYPILGCWVMENWQESGLTPVVIAREQAPDKVIFGVCLVDRYCLGVKDAYANADFPRARFERELSRICIGAPQECSVELAHEIVYGALEYAQRYGFSPHPDFTRQMVDKVLDPPDAHPRSGKVEFGKDGKPFFFAGPYEDEHRIMQIINTLRRTAGDGNFTFVIPIDPAQISKV